MSHQPISRSMAAISGNSAVTVAAVAVVLPTRPRAIPLAMITTRKASHGFAGRRLAALRATGTSLLNFSHV